MKFSKKVDCTAYGDLIKLEKRTPSGFVEATFSTGVMIIMPMEQLMKCHIVMTPKGAAKMRENIQKFLNEHGEKAPEVGIGEAELAFARQFL